MPYGARCKSLVPFLIKKTNLSFNVIDFFAMQLAENERI